MKIYRLLTIMLLINASFILPNGDDQELPDLAQTYATYLPDSGGLWLPQLEIYMS